MKVKNKFVYHKERSEKMTRLEIKGELAKHGLRQWEIAKQLSVSEATVSKMMRCPTDEQVTQIMNAITALTKTA